MWNSKKGSQRAINCPLSDIFSLQQVTALSKSELCIYPSESGKSSLHYTMQQLKSALPDVLIKVPLNLKVFFKNLMLFGGANKIYFKNTKKSQNAIVIHVGRDVRKMKYGKSAGKLARVT